MEIHGLLTDRLPLHQAGQPKAAAVLIALTDEEDPGVILTRRSEDLKFHPGQISLPGGRVETGETPIQAALRETWEETGVPPKDVRVLGRLPFSMPRGARSLTPVVGTVPVDVRPYAKSTTEVDSVFMPRLSELVDPANRATCYLSSTENRGPAFAAGGHVIWGLTAFVLDTFLATTGLSVPWDTTRIIDVPAMYRMTGRRWIDSN